jgi:thiol-disulfide isomerase/thioredoxin
LGCCSPSEHRLAAALAGWLVLAGAAARADEAPLAVEDADGAQVELALDAGAAALVVHFWASWCAECVEDLPLLEEAAARCTGSVHIAAVNVGESHEDAERFRARHGLRLPLLRDPEGRLFRRFARGLPANLIWTREGRRVLTGPYGRAAWDAELAELGCEPARAP